MSDFIFNIVSAMALATDNAAKRFIPVKWVRVLLIPVHLAWICALLPIIWVLALVGIIAMLAEDI